MRRWAMMEEMHRHKSLLAKALLRMKNRLAATALQTWAAYLVWRKRKQSIMNRWKNPFAAKSFHG